jgi:hypothetical protein
MDNHPELLVGLALFVLSELIGVSKLKDNSVLQLTLHMARELFPYELHRREPATRQNRPSRKRDANGRFAGGKLGKGQ